MEDDFTWTAYGWTPYTHRQAPGVRCKMLTRNALSSPAVKESTGFHCVGRGGGFRSSTPISTPIMGPTAKHEQSFPRWEPCIDDHQLAVTSLSKGEKTALILRVIITQKKNPVPLFLHPRGALIGHKNLQRRPESRRCSAHTKTSSMAIWSKLDPLVGDQLLTNCQKLNKIRACSMVLNRPLFTLLGGLGFLLGGYN